MESQARERKKTQLLTGGCVSNQGSQSGAVRKATVGSDQLRLTQASELSRFPDFGCAQCSLPPTPQAHIPTSPQDAGGGHLSQQWRSPQWVRSGMASACRGWCCGAAVLRCCWRCCVWRGRRCVVAPLLFRSYTDMHTCRRAGHDRLDQPVRKRTLTPGHPLQSRLN